MKELQIDKLTAIEWYSYMREVVSNDLIKNKNAKIGGEGQIVEADESLFTRQTNHSGRILLKQWIFGGLYSQTKLFSCRDPWQIGKKSLLRAIEENVHKGSIIYSDSWEDYSTVNLEDA